LTIAFRRIHGALKIDAGLRFGVDDGNVERGEIACESEAGIVKMGD